ncbi:MAG: ribonuclease III [Henriciella sp.]|nr:ribonuclease III [Henriciella sp.]
MKRPARPKRTRLRAGAKARTRPTLSTQQRGKLEEIIGYRFKNEDLLTRALTHPSLIDDFGGGVGFSNQRLEFLGDRVLGLVMAEILINKYPKEREGHMTKLFHHLVSGPTCAAVGAKINLRDYLFLDASMKHNRSGHYDKAVADGVEALIAAIYHDSGLDAAERFIKKCWIFDTLTKKASEPNANPKTRLSDWCGAHQAAYAVYATLSQDGPAHAPVFTVQVEVDGHGSATATGGNKQEAEKAAAAALLDKLEQND